MILLVVFVMIERGSAHPLLPLRIVLDRNRGGSYLSVLISGAGLFGVFLFLTFYLQKTLAYSPVIDGTGVPADGGDDHRQLDDLERRAASAVRAEAARPRPACCWPRSGW